MVSEDLIDELDAIEAIYPECLKRVNDGLIDLKIPQHEDYTARISFPEKYPDTEPPHILQVRSQGTDDPYLQGLFNEVLDSVYQQGSVCVFELLTELEGILYVEEDETDANPSEIQAQPVQVDAFDGWIMSEPVTDRGSTFIAFVRTIDTENELYEKLALLKSDRKIARANHNMVAFRIQNDNGTRVSDCDDDGETAAGGRLLHLLQIMDVWNVIVVVSRWFGGTHIGPDRFKHINSTARDAIIKAGLLEDSKPNGKCKKKK
jgi:putative IMPACT (imprinted ancient) family translation regulator